MLEPGSNTKLVTAVLVCWNHERFVRAAVLSALNQSYRNIQIIVFDNGSTDASRRELESLRAEHDFTLVCQENVGLVRALNQGLAMAKGDYFAVLSTDDIWRPEKTGLQARYLDEHPDVHLVSGRLEGIDVDGRLNGLPVSDFAGDVTFADLMKRGNLVQGAAIMCRTETLRSIGGYDESQRIEDYSLALKLTHMGLRVVVLPDVCTRYRRHETNWTLRSLDAELREIGDAYRRTPEYRDFYRMHFPLAFWHLVKAGKKREALRTLLYEPEEWTWGNVGRGLIRMCIPYILIQTYRAVNLRREKAKNAELV